MRTKKRWVLGAFSGFFFGFFLGLLLLGMGVIALDSPLLTTLPFIFLVLGVAGALWAPRGPRAPKREPVAAPPDVSEFTGTPAVVPPPPLGDPTPPPDVAPKLHDTDPVPPTTSEPTEG